MNMEGPSIMQIYIYIYADSGQRPPPIYIKKWSHPYTYRSGAPHTHWRKHYVYVYLYAYVLESPFHMAYLRVYRGGGGPFYVYMGAPLLYLYGGWTVRFLRMRAPLRYVYGGWAVRFLTHT